MTDTQQCEGGTTAIFSRRKIVTILLSGLGATLVGGCQRGEPNVLFGPASSPKTTWIPATVAGSDNLEVSKFGGLACLSNESSYPACKFCKKRLNLAWQLQLDTLPCGEQELQTLGFSKLPSNSMCQCFMCSNYDCLTNDDMQSATLVQVVQRTDCSKATVKPQEQAFPAKLITGWHGQTDQPETDDGEVSPYDGDKLLGLPRWVQWPRQVQCNKCKHEMKYFFQLASKQNIPFEFGDSGLAYIFLCPQDWSGALVWDSH